MMKYLSHIVFLIMLSFSGLFFVAEPAQAYSCPDGCDAAQCNTEKCANCSFCDGEDHCNFTNIKNAYLKEGSTSLCWYCRIVSIMTNAYLTAVDTAMKVVKTMGDIILKYGFLIWLAYYILQQVSSMAPTTPGKMLQEVAIMGFKVLIATEAVHKGIPVLTTYFLDPVMLTGVEYGSQMLSGLIG